MQKTRALSVATNTKNGQILNVFGSIRYRKHAGRIAKDHQSALPSF